MVTARAVTGADGRNTFGDDLGELKATDELVATRPDVWSIYIPAADFVRIKIDNLLVEGYRKSDWPDYAHLDQARRNAAIRKLRRFHMLAAWLLREFPSLSGEFVKCGFQGVIREIQTPAGDFRADAVRIYPKRGKRK